MLHKTQQHSQYNITSNNYNFKSFFVLSLKIFVKKYKMFKILHEQKCLASPVSSEKTPANPAHNSTCLTPIVQNVHFLAAVETNCTADNVSLTVHTTKSVLWRVATDLMFNF